MAVMTIHGLDAFLSGLAAAPELTRVRASKAVAASTFATERTVSNLAPQDTGTLKRAIHSRSAQLQGQVLIGPEAYYWRFVEYGSTRALGTSGGRRVIGARPFVRTAAEQEHPEFIRRLEDVVNDVASIISSGRFL